MFMHLREIFRTRQICYVIIYKKLKTHTFRNIIPEMQEILRNDGK